MILAAISESSWASIATAFFAFLTALTTTERVYNDNRVQQEQSKKEELEKHLDDSRVLGQS